MEEISRAMDSTLHEWSCAETVLALGALASALPTRQVLTDQTLIHSVMHDLASTDSRQSAESYKC